MPTTGRLGGGKKNGAIRSLGKRTGEKIVLTEKVVMGKHNFWGGDKKPLQRFRKKGSTGSQHRSKTVNVEKWEGARGGPALSSKIQTKRH